MKKKGADSPFLIQSVTLLKLAGHFNSYWNPCTCVLTWACVCSNSSSFMLFETGTWNTYMPATLLHSDLTLPMAMIASSRVNRQLKAKLSNFSSKGYDGTSGWNPRKQGTKRSWLNFDKVLGSVSATPCLGDKRRQVISPWHLVIEPTKLFAYFTGQNQIQVDFYSWIRARGQRKLRINLG